MKYLKLILSVFLLSSSAGFAQTGSYPQENFTKKEMYITMRDGVKLYTAVYTPKDASKDKKYPMIMQRTCYSI
ncbi:MAG: X-Pro dipeptidyl-peptidase, partial [Chitinophagaceae bacterium]